MSINEISILRMRSKFVLYLMLIFLMILNIIWLGL